MTPFKLLNSLLPNDDQGSQGNQDRALKHLTDTQTSWLSQNLSPRATTWLSQNLSPRATNNLSLPVANVFSDNSGGLRTSALYSRRGKSEMCLGQGSPRSERSNGESGTASASHNCLSYHGDGRLLDIRKLPSPRDMRSFRCCNCDDFSIDKFNFDHYKTNSDAALSATLAATVSQTHAISGGTIKFGIVYSASSGQLEVFVMCATELRQCCDDDDAMAKGASRKSPRSLSPSPASTAMSCSVSSGSVSHAACSPYVRARLNPDKSQCVLTSVKTGTSDPVWNEKVAFGLSLEQSLLNQLELVVKNYNKCNSRHQFLGRVSVPLKDIDISGGDILTLPLMDCSEELDEVGEILISLYYLPGAQRLIVDVLKIRNILQLDLEKKLNPVVHIKLAEGNKSIKAKRSSVKKNTTTADINESFRYDVCEEILQTASLIISVCDHRGALKNDLIGRVVLGVKESTGQPETAHWQELIAVPHKQVTKWHNLVSRDQHTTFPTASTLSNSASPDLA